MFVHLNLFSLSPIILPPSQACLHSCFQRTMLRECGCGYLYFPLPAGAASCDYNKHPAWGKGENGGKSQKKWEILGKNGEKTEKIWEKKTRKIWEQTRKSGENGKKREKREKFGKKPGESGKM